MCTDKKKMTLVLSVGDMGPMAGTYISLGTTSVPIFSFFFYIDVCNIYCLVESMVTQDDLKKWTKLFAHGSERM